MINESKQDFKRAAQVIKFLVGFAFLMTVLFFIILGISIFTHYDDTNYRATSLGVIVGYYLCIALRLVMLKIKLNINYLN